MLIDMPKILKNIDRVNSNPLLFAQQVSKKTLEQFILKCNTKYHNGQSIISDDKYDILYDFLQKSYPNSNLLNQVGAETVGKEKVELPVFLGSMDKIKADSNSLEKWCLKYKNKKVISDKLDGISLLIQEKNGLKAFTRGNGKEGQNISWILKHIKIGNGLKNAMIRGELIISKDNWAIVKAKYPEFSNPRNFVSGMVTRKNIDISLIQYLDFVGYEFIKENESFTSETQLKNIKDCGFKCVYYEIIENINNKTGSEKLLERREQSEYEIDGIIITDNGYYNRPEKNPDYAKAFKMVINSQCAETFVESITWTPSMYGVLKPVVNVVQTTIEGVNITKVTGNNANFILNNNIGGMIGPGSKILLTRSGGVIPKILKVMTPYTQDSKNCLPNCEYQWNSTKVDIVLTNPALNDIVKRKRIEHFFKSISVNYLKEGIVQKLFEHKYDTVKKIMNMSIEDFLSVEGIKQKMAEKLYNEIKLKYEKSSSIDIMVGSLVFPNIGKKTLDIIVNKFGDTIILNYSQEHKQDVKEKLYKLKGLGKENVDKIVEQIPLFQQYYNNLKLT